MNLNEKILKLQEEVKAIPKNGHNKFGNYDYWKLSDVTNKVKELCIKYKLVFTHEDITEEKTIINHLDYETKKYNERIKEYEILVTHEVEIAYSKLYEIRDCESEEVLSFPFLACAKNTDIAKAKGSAETYAYRYFLMNLLLLSEDELDPDNDGQIIYEKKSSLNKDDEFLKIVNNNELLLAKAKKITKDMFSDDWFKKLPVDKKTEFKGIILKHE